eukprot:9927874-Alexandrium_andersonii.AAC.1
MLEEALAFTSPRSLKAMRAGGSLLRRPTRPGGTLGVAAGPRAGSRCARGAPPRWDSGHPG